MKSLLDQIKHSPGFYLVVFLITMPLGYGKYLLTRHLWRSARRYTGSIHHASRYGQEMKNGRLIEDSRNLIDARTRKNPDAPPNEAYAARAAANEGIARVFGLRNAFTVEEDPERKDFTTFAKKKLVNADFQHLANSAQDILKRELQRGHCKLEDYQELSHHFRRWGTALEPVVQLLTFKVAAELIFGNSPASFKDGDVWTATDEIDRLWIAAKKTEDVRELKPFVDQHKLRDSLHAMFPDRDLDSHDYETGNPMNFIIPSYEAIWRVVLLGFLECQHHVFHPSNEMSRAASCSSHRLNTCKSSYKTRTWLKTLTRIMTATGTLI